jgi:CRP-like cAMP-binding protein
MENEAVKYLSKHISLSEEVARIVEESTIIRHYEKGDFLLRQGERPNESYLVFKGCIRSYLLKDGEEKTIEFYTEGQAVMPPDFGNETPSELTYECTEATSVGISTPEHEKAMFSKYPQFESICLVMSEVLAASYQKTFLDYRTTTAEERYIKLLKTRPGLAQRVPQYQLASYLGIKPESLSRIRKRLSQK